MLWTPFNHSKKDRGSLDFVPSYLYGTDDMTVKGSRRQSQIKIRTVFSYTLRIPATPNGCHSSFELTSRPAY